MNQSQRLINKIITLSLIGVGGKEYQRLKLMLDMISPSLSFQFQVKEISSVNEILSYGIGQTPALAISDQIILEGEVPNEQQLIERLEKVLQTN